MPSILDLARAEHLALISTLSERFSRTMDRVDRLIQAGAPRATIREESYRASGSDRRRSTVRIDGTIALPGDACYQGRMLVVCTAPLPVSPCALKWRLSRLARHDTRDHERLVDRLHRERAARERDLRYDLRQLGSTRGARRKALIYRIKATLFQYPDDQSLQSIALDHGWRLD